jgi:SGNH domain (fused to AT3 domains)
LPVASTALLIGSIAMWPRAFNDLSNNRISQWLGAISYPLYLWHWPALVLPSSTLGRPLRVRERIFFIALTIVLAHLTSKYIEQPIRDKKVAGKKIYLFFAATTVTSIVAGLIISSTASSMINVKGTDYKFNLTKVMQKPVVYGDGCHVNYGETKSGYCTYGDVQSATTVVLYGDSHAAQWFPALEKLARERHFKLISLTKSACPSVDVPRADQGAFKNVHCEKWRKSIHPAAVIMSSFQYFTPPSGFPDKNKWWRDGQLRLLTELRGTSDHLIYISDTPRPVRDIPNCLASRDSHSCDSTERTPVRIINGFEKIDPTGWLCSTYCPAIQNGYVVYRDASHISVAAALALKPQLETALLAEGLFS